MTTHDVTGGYRYLEGVFQYSGGVRALDGYRIERVRFRKSPALSEGFDAHRELPRRSRPAARQLLRLRAALARPVHGSRLPQLQRNLCEDAGALGRSSPTAAIPSPAAMSVRRSTRRRSRSSMPSAMPGRAWRRRPASSSPAAAKSVGGRRHLPRSHRGLRRHQPAGMRQKARSVLAEMERRLGALGLGWKDTTDTQVYTVFDVHPYLADDLVRRGAANRGFTWHFCRPPIHRPRIRDGLPGNRNRTHALSPKRRRSSRGVG